VIEVQNLTVSYDGGKPALKDVSLTARPGEVTGYLGPNGAGKSTTMKVLAGLLRPTAGSARIAGLDMTEQPLEAKRQLSYIPESAALYTSLTANEYLSMVAELYHMERSQAAAKIQQLLTVFDLTAAADKPIESYSKGMRQKTLLASGLVHDAEVYLFDEPLNGLDSNAVQSVRRLIAELASRGKTILYCSHILPVVERVCQRVILLRDGEIVADAPTAELLGRSKEGTLEAVFQELTAGMNESVWNEWKGAFFGSEAGKASSSISTN
jgi:ABC-2 type transport system ATP-binding protein